MSSSPEGRKKVKELLLNGFIYAGGDFNEHKNYWPTFASSRGLNIDRVPKFKNYCICGEEISRNCWVYNPDTRRIKVIGSECINKFKIGRRRCIICNKAHQNRKVNKCKECRIGHCDNCNKNIDERFKLCYTCNFG